MTPRVNGVTMETKFWLAPNFDDKTVWVEALKTQFKKTVQSVVERRGQPFWLKPILVQGGHCLCVVRQVEFGVAFCFVLRPQGLFL